jgi:uncharacterized membrane protein
MEEYLRLIAGTTATLIEFAAVLTVTFGAAEAMVHIVRRLIPASAVHPTRRAIWARFAGWIILALEFTLGADIIRTAIAPSWNDIGQLAAVAAIRTGLNFFLERDFVGERELPPQKSQ